MSDLLAEDLFFLDKIEIISILFRQRNKLKQEYYYIL